MTKLKIKFIDENELKGFFLCSANVEIGEKVYYQMEGFKLCEGKIIGKDNEDGIDFINVESKSKESIYVYYPNEPEINDESEAPFKIIGEISPSAIEKGYIYDNMIIENLEDIYIMPSYERKYAGWPDSEFSLIEVRNPEDNLLY